jgi:hypothetical protein
MDNQKILEINDIFYKERVKENKKYSLVEP